jgi:hypothetical protein
MAGYASVAMLMLAGDDPNLLRTREWGRKRDKTTNRESKRMKANAVGYGEEGVPAKILHPFLGIGGASGPPPPPFYARLHPL